MGEILKNNKVIKRKIPRLRTANSPKYSGKKTSLKYEEEENTSTKQQQ